ncbi:hypothetical protein SAMN03159306_03399 [Pseudomonas sp. NFACC48-1]|nr:hypothetical protein SAMN03159405_02638 [Pseudomonas sp. NFACC44-2]SDA42910.1 hypothetical protein SAMN03159429_00260 [Pseudomonas sp. NFACC51]SDX84566.1 hypothetical protein SAMN03159474_04036 [Pseudomonas sp. NFACC08-1]SFH55494.1 hypothetical protein SAMN03159302_01948 [Pseudomonas sp. NFACC54]SFT04762.1 hypothetical protein SAMN03159306_03399 [Pseudomonas sp. NFACC48-1]
MLPDGCPPGLTDSSQSVLEGKPLGDVARGITLHVGNRFRAQFAHDFGRCPQNQGVVRKYLALGHNRPGANQAVFADDRTVEHNRLNPDQRAIADRATVQHGLVADGDPRPHGQQESRVSMQHGAFLYVAALADSNRFVVAAQNGLGPDTYSLFQRDSTNDCGLIGNEGFGVDRGDKRVVLIDSHGNASSG